MAKKNDWKTPLWMRQEQDRINKRHFSQISVDWTERKWGLDDGPRQSTRSFHGNQDLQGCNEAKHMVIYTQYCICHILLKNVMEFGFCLVWPAAGPGRAASLALHSI